MKKLLLLLLMNNLTIFSAARPPLPIVPPQPIIPNLPPAPTPAPIVPQAAPIVPQVPPMMPQVPPMMPQPAPNFQAGQLAKPKATPNQPVTQTKDDLATVNIQNLSNITATIKGGTAKINDKENQSISINTTLEPKQKEPVSVTIFTYVPESNKGGLEFNNLTSITINEEKLSLNPPVNQSENIYINNVNEQWRIVSKPKKISPKQTLVKPVTKAALNIQEKTHKSSAAKTAKNSVIPPMTPAPQTIPTKK